MVTNDGAAAGRMAALSDPTRLQIVQVLSKGPTSVGDIARRVPVSRPAVSQHLRILEDAGLVTHRPAGTRHMYRLDPRGIAAMRAYLDSLWQRALTQFKAEAERSSPARKEKHREHHRKR